MAGHHDKTNMYLGNYDRYDLSTIDALFYRCHEFPRYYQDGSTAFPMVPSSQLQGVNDYPAALSTPLHSLAQHERTAWLSESALPPVLYPAPLPIFSTLQQRQKSSSKREMVQRIQQRWNKIYETTTVPVSQQGKPATLVLCGFQTFSHFALH
jgi:hypothetical protein